MWSYVNTPSPASDITEIPQPNITDPDLSQDV